MAQIETPIPKLKLNDGRAIPMLAYGTGTAWYKTGDEEQVDRSLIDATKMAIGMGYHHLDGAEVYKTESELGTAIVESGVERSKLYVTTKVLPNIADIPAAIDTSLEKLKIDYVDLYLIHAPYFGQSERDLQVAWAAMEQVQASGKAKSIGVSNFKVKDLEALRQTQKVPPAMNQIEFHPYLQHEELLNYHKKHGIATAAYAPLTPVTKACPGPLDDFLASLSKKYSVNPSEILLRFCIDQDIVPITTSGKEQRLSDMLRVALIKLTPKEIKTMVELGEKKHFRAFWQHKHDANDRS